MMNKKIKPLVIPFFIVVALVTIYLTFVSCSGSDPVFAQVKGANSISAIEKYLKENPGSKSFKEAIIYRDSLVFDSIKKIDKIRAYRYFISNYPQAEQVKLANKRIKELHGIKAVVSTFRGNFQRNYYGDKIPSKLDVLWTLNFGSSKSTAYGREAVWTGAGWTGQPLVITEDTVTYLIQGAYDYNLRKINAETGKVIWRYKYDDIIKGTGTIWFNEKETNPDNRIVIMNGSRRGEVFTNDKKLRTSFRQVSYYTGVELWRYSSDLTPCYSRDCDASCVTIGDTAYQSLENGTFMVFDPDYRHAAMKDGVLQPKVIQQLELWKKEDIDLHHNNVVNESSPTLFNDKIYIMGGAGSVFAFNIKSKQIDWQFFIGPDLDGSIPVTDDSCLLVNFKPAYQCTKGGVYKLDPSKDPKEAVIWYCPVENRQFELWKGGIIGSIAINDSYISKDETHLAAWLAIDGNLYVVDHKSLSDKKAIGPDGKEYPMPKIIYKTFVGSSISSPIIVGNRLVACTYNGIYLFEFDKDLKFKLLAKRNEMSYEASPIAWNNRIYVTSNSTGLMYCFGEK